MEPVSRTSRDGHILISGTGRAGTTLLVQYFTALGFDTGHDLSTSKKVNPTSNAGLEHTLNGTYGKRLPYVAKAPRFTESLGPALEAGAVDVRACIVPMRDLFAAAESRRAVAREAESGGQDPTLVPGSLAFGAHKNPASQERRLAVQFYKLVHTLVLHDIPVYFLRFPDFATGRQDLFHQLGPLLAQHGVTAQESADAMALVARPELIHDFTAR